MADYYEILGITEEEKKLQGKDFKKALNKHWREIGKKYHPDKAKDDKERVEFEEKFKQANEAYQVLSDDNKRQQYDLGGVEGMHMGGGMDFDAMRAAMDAMRQHMHGGFGFDPFGEQTHRQQVVKGDDIKVKLHLNIHEIFSGTTKTFKINKQHRCEHCNGTGSENGKIETCPVCQGLGVIRETVRRGNFISIQQRPCSHCQGTGQVISTPCTVCGGKGFNLKEEEITVTIPRSVYGGTILTQQGKGNPVMVPGVQGVNGDLYIKIEEDDDNTFMHNENGHLLTYLNLTIEEALVGCKKEVPTIEGKKIMLTIPEGTSDGSTFSAKGKGLYESPYGSQRGNMFIEVVYEMPKKLTDRQKELLKEFYEIEKTKSRR